VKTSFGGGQGEKNQKDHASGLERTGGVRRRCSVALFLLALEGGLNTRGRGKEMKKRKRGEELEWSIQGEICRS